MILLGTVNISAQAAKPDAKDKAAAKPDEKDKQAEPAQNQKPAGWAAEPALLGTISLPMGDVGSILNMGFGGRLDITTHIPALPFLKQGGFDIRPGFFAGAILHSVKSDTKTGNFFAAPAVVYASLDLTSLSSMLTPYFAAGAGVSMASAKSTTTSTGVSESVSSVDMTVYAALGAKTYLGADKRIFVKAEASFFMVFEEVNGMFIQGNLGVGYRL